MPDKRLERARDGYEGYVYRPSRIPTWLQKMAVAMKAISENRPTIAVNGVVVGRVGDSIPMN